MATEDLIGMTFDEAYAKLGTARAIKEKGKLFEARSGCTVPVSNPASAEDAELTEESGRLKIETLDDALFAEDMAEVFRKDDVYADSTGAGTEEAYSNTPKPGFFKSLKSKHPYVHKALVIGAIVGTLGLAAALAGCTSSPAPAKEKPTNPPASGNMPLYCEAYLNPTAHQTKNSGVVDFECTLQTLDKNISKGDVSLDVFNSKGQKVAHATDFQSGSGADPYNRDVTKYFISSYKLAGLNPNDFLNGSYLVKITSKGSQKNSVIEFKTIPASASKAYDIEFFNATNHVISVNTGLGADDSSVSLTYTLLDSSGKVLKSVTKNGYDQTVNGMRKQYCDLPGLDPEKVYSSKVEFTISGNSGYMSMPFSPSKTVSYG
ncbi:MAG: hypothetical protein V1839_00370 [archaeon]